MRCPRSLFLSAVPVLLPGLLLLFGLTPPGIHRLSAQESAEAIPSPTPKSRPYPFKSVVFSVDAEMRYFRMGKHRVRQVYVVETSKLRHDDGRPAVLEDLIEGIEIRGSIRKRPDGNLEAVTVIIGTPARLPPGE